MAVDIKKVSSNKSLRKFIRFPFDLYRTSPHWVPPLYSDEMKTLREDKNPAFEFNRARYWLAYKDGKAVGRIAAIINDRYIEKWDKKYARFGWVDFIDDREVSEALFAAAESWAKAEGMEGMNGPIGFTNLDKEGMLIEGFDEMGTQFMIYNYPYYPEHLERLGYSKDADWVEYEIQVPKEIPEKVIRVGEISLKRSGLRLVDAKKAKDFSPYIAQVFDVLNEAYSGLYGTVELSKKQVETYIKKYFNYIDPRFSNVIVDKEDKVAAFGLAFPSLTKALQKSRGRKLPTGWIHLLKAFRHPTQIDLALVAVREQYQNRGLPAILMSEVNRSCLQCGVLSAESSGELEENTQVQAFWKHYDSRLHKRRRAYLKSLS